MVEVAAAAPHWQSIDAKHKPRIGEHVRIKWVKVEDGKKIEFWMQGWTYVASRKRSILCRSEIGDIEILNVDAKQAVQYWHDDAKRRAHDEAMERERIKESLLETRPTAMDKP